MSAACDMLPAMLGVAVLILAAQPAASATELTAGVFVKVQDTTYREGILNPDGFSVRTLDLDHGRASQVSLNAAVSGGGPYASWDIELGGVLVHERCWSRSLQIKQLYCQWAPGDHWDVTAGRVILRWGTGFAINPTDVVAPAKDLSDPENEERKIAGNEMAKLEYFGDGCSFALCYVTSLDEIAEPRKSRLVCRLYKSIRSTDLSLVSLHEAEKTPLWGFSLSTVVGSRVEGHAEASFQRGSYSYYHAAADNGNGLSAGPLFTDSRRSGGVYWRYLIGIRWTMPWNIEWIIEYYHQDHGYSESEWKRIMDYARLAASRLKTAEGLLAGRNLLQTLGVFSPRGAMRDYIMNYLDAPIGKGISMRSISLLNVGDASFVVIPEIRVSSGNHLTFYVRDTIFVGGEGTEFGEFLSSHSAEGGVRLNL